MVESIDRLAVLHLRVESVILLLQSNTFWHLVLVDVIIRGAFVANQVIVFQHELSIVHGC